MKRSSSMDQGFDEDDEVRKRHTRLRSSKQDSSRHDQRDPSPPRKPDPVNIEIRSRMKKDLLEQYLHICQISKQIDFQIQQHEAEKTLILQEQQELLTEREKCREHDAQMSGNFDIDKPQYMDERLDIIVNDLDVIEDKIYNLTLYSTSYTEDGQIIQNFDQGWQDVLLVLDTLQFDEFRMLTSMFISELVDLRALMHDSQMQISEKENTIYELRASFDHMRDAAIEASMEYEKKNTRAIQYNTRIIDFVAGCYESKSFPTSMSGFLNEINLPQTDVYSSHASLTQPETTGEKESSQYIHFSKDLSRNIEKRNDMTPLKPRKEQTYVSPMREDPKVEINTLAKLPPIATAMHEQINEPLLTYALPPIYLNTPQKESKMNRAVKLEWKQLDFLSGMKFDEPKALQSERSNLRLSNLDYTMSESPRQTKLTLPEPIQTNIMKLPDISTQYQLFDSTNDFTKKNEPGNRQVMQLIEESKEDASNSERRKSFDKIFSLGKNAMNWARGRSKGMSRAGSISLHPQDSENTILQEDSRMELDPTHTNTSDAINQDSTDNRDSHVAWDLDLDPKRIRSNSNDISMEDVKLDEESHVLRKSKSVAQQMGGDVFSRLATAHTKASEVKKKGKFMNNF